MWRPNLPDIEDIEELRELPRVFPHFFVPQLSDKPQNPIMDTLTLTATNKALPPRPIPPSLPPELLILSADLEPVADYRTTSSLWTQAVTRTIGQRVCMLFSYRMCPLSPARTNYYHGIDCVRHIPLKRHQHPSSLSKTVSFLRLPDISQSLNYHFSL